MGAWRSRKVRLMQNSVSAKSTQRPRSKLPRRDPQRRKRPPTREEKKKGTPFTSLTFCSPRLTRRHKGDRRDKSCRNQRKTTQRVKGGVLMMWLSPVRRLTGRREQQVKRKGGPLGFWGGEKGDSVRPDWGSGGSLSKEGRGGVHGAAFNALAESVPRLGAPKKRQGSLRRKSHQTEEWSTKNSSSRVRKVGNSTFDPGSCRSVSRTKDRANGEDHKHRLRPSRL